MAKAHEITSRKRISEHNYKTLKKVASDMNYPLTDLMIAYAIESDSGHNMGSRTKTHKGHFQFDDNTASDYNLKNPFDLGSSATAHINLVRDRKKKIKSLAFHGPPEINTQRDYFDDLTSESTAYLLHQQGKWGTERLGIGYEEDDYIADRGSYVRGEKEMRPFRNRSSRINMLANLTDDQKAVFKSKNSPRESTEYFAKATNANVANVKSIVQDWQSHYELPDMTRAVLDSAAVDTFLTRESE